MARNGIWRRQYGTITLSGLHDTDQATIGQPGPPDGFTVVRNIGSVTVELQPNSGSGITHVWMGLARFDAPGLDPAVPMDPPSDQWLWWDYVVIGPEGTIGPAAGESTFGPRYLYRSFDMHGFRILNPTQGDFLAFYATQDTPVTPAPAAVRVNFGISSFFLGPP